MTSPTVHCQINFTANPLTSSTGATATYTDCTPYLRGEMHIRRGRNHERQEFEAGTLSFTLDNKDRRFDPDNSSGPYYPNVKPMRKVRIRGQWPVGTFTRMFEGYIESWRPDYDEGNNAVVHVEAVDAMKLFNLYIIGNPGTSPERLTSATIGAVLTGIGWHATQDRQILTGVVTMQSQTGLIANALSYMQLVARTEGGQFFVSKEGAARFEGRDYRTGLVGPFRTFSDNPTGIGLPYAALDMSNDDSHIWNYITITRDGGLVQAAQDATSIASFALRQLNLSGLLYRDDTDAMDAAQLYLARYKDARSRPARFVIDGAVRNVWSNLLDLEISQIISIERTGLLGGSVFAGDFHIEALDWRIRKNDWDLQLQLSPRVTNATGTATVMTGTRWLVPTLSSPWVNAGGGEANAGYWKDAGGWVYLRGTITSGSLGGLITQLPVGYRPPYYMRSTIALVGGAGVIGIGPDGWVSFIDAYSGWTPGPLDMNGVTFKVD